MIRKKTVFVLGAGSSMPYNLPSGSALWRRLASEPGFYHDVAESGGMSTTDFAQRVRRGQSNSIDAFLTASENADLLDIGKRAIAFVILAHESEKRLLLPNDDGEHWYKRLVNSIMATESGSNNIDLLWNAPVTYITFNYDRSFEQYLYNVAIGHGVAPVEAWEKVTALPILHCYGLAGELPNPERPQDGGVVYGDSRGWETAAEGIRLLGESSGERATLDGHASSAIQDADRVIITGFGFHPFNMAHLGMGDWLESTGPEIWATTKGLGIERRRALEALNAVRSAATPRQGGRVIERKDVTTAQLLEDHLVLTD